MIEFVNKIESKRGWASMEDVFLDLISFYQIFGPGTNIDAMEPKDQLMFMYQYLKNRKDKLCDADLI
jgi:hypothetical protein